MLFAIASILWLFGLFAIGLVVFILLLFIVYKLTGGKLNFINWFKKMKF